MCFDHIHPLLLPLNPHGPTLTPPPHNFVSFLFFNNPLMAIYAAHMLMGVGHPRSVGRQHCPAVLSLLPDQMTQQVKSLVAKPDNLKLIPGTHMVEENQLPQVSSDLHIRTVAHTCVHTHAHR